MQNKLEEIYKLYIKDMYSTAYSILRDKNDAEDAVHETIIRISRNISKFIKINSKKIRAYIIIIVRNISYDIYNKKKGIILLEKKYSRKNINRDVSLEDELLKKELHEDMLNYFNKINQRYSDILVLRYYNELSVKEISKDLNISENNARVRISRALKALRNVLEEGGYKDD